MSANLLAELDDFYRNDAQLSTGGLQHAAPAHPLTSDAHFTFADIPTQTSPEAATAFEDDDFGDFETGSLAAPKAAQDFYSPGEERDLFDTWSPASPVVRQYSDIPRPKPLRASSSDIIQGRLNAPTVQASVPPRPVGKKRDDDVLFDAEDEPEDDFGEFAEAISDKTVPRPLEVQLQPIESRKGVKVPPKKQPAPSLLDLGGDGPTSTIPLTPTGGKLASAQQKPSDSKLGKGQPAQPVERVDGSFDAWEPIDTNPAGSTAFSAPDDEAWDDFTEDMASTSIAGPAATQENLNLSPLLQHEVPEGAVPPTNIPPPAVLLPVFPHVFGKIKADLFDQLPSDATAKAAALHAPTVAEYLKDVITVSIACAHIIAGRKCRWKRDNILSQSMKIGQASGRNGMKLAGLDRSETSKEDREAADVIRAWKLQLGRLRSTLASAEGMPRLPEISETMPVRMASQSEGAITSPKPCVLCGLKRNERIPKVDVGVQDSFGEFWVEHHGHRSCVSFWESYKHELAGR